MKVPAILLSACFLLIASHSVRAQADCLYWIRVEVRDQADAPIKNAKLKLDDWQEFYFWENSKKYEATGLMGVGAPVWQAKLRVKAKGFKQFTEELSISCSNFDFILRLSPKGSKAPAVFDQIARENFGLVVP